MIKILSAFVLNIIAIVWLSCSLFTVAKSFVISIIFNQLINAFGCYGLLGIGIGLPIVLSAGALGWVQLLLLINGTIDPHLAREGFFKVLNTLFSKI